MTVSSSAGKSFVGPINVPPPPVPAAPPLAYRYLGEMTDPGGQRFVYLSKGDKEYPVTVGSKLDEGYVVESITAETIGLYYPMLGLRAAIHIQPVQEPSTR